MFVKNQHQIVIYFNLHKSFHSQQELYWRENVFYTLARKWLPFGHCDNFHTNSLPLETLDQRPKRQAHYRLYMENFRYRSNLYYQVWYFRYQTFFFLLSKISNFSQVWHSTCIYYLRNCIIFKLVMCQLQNH